MDKKDAMFMAFIADYSWDAIKQTKKNINLPKNINQISNTQNDQVDNKDKLRHKTDQFKKMSLNFEREFNKKQAHKLQPYGN